MRMRRKSNLEERLAACGDKILYLDRDVLDFSVKDDRDLLDCCDDHDLDPDIDPDDCFEYGGNEP